MNKSEVLALLNACENKAKMALSRTDLSQKEKERIENIANSITYHQVYVDTRLTDADTEALKKYATQFTALYEELKKLSVPTSLMVRPETDIVKVKKVIPKEKQQEKTQKERKKVWDIIRNILAVLGAVAIVAALVWSLKSCDITSKEELDDDKPKYEQTQDENKRPIDDINIENYDELLGYAQLLQGKLPENTDITIEDIMYAIRLTNFDTLEDKAIFKDRDEVYESTRIAGRVASELGSDTLVKRDPETDIFVSETELKDIIMCATDNNISIEEFVDSKTENGYDIYSIADRCVKGINTQTENDVYFAKIFNDLLARKAVAFTITEESPISTYYTLLGMYNANSKRILELTSNIGLTAVYGDGTRIDGYYGFICVEYLESYLHVGNEKNLLYTDVIDQNITNYAQEAELNQSR